jgi:hypothetical protein
MCPSNIDTIPCKLVLKNRCFKVGGFDNPATPLDIQGGNLTNEPKGQMDRRQRLKENNNKHHPHGAFRKPINATNKMMFL